MDPDKIKGDIQRPYRPPEDKETSDKIDPEKFKKVMKIDESEEAQKRKKRNLSREEEEGEDEPAVEEPTTPAGSFSEFMSDKEDLDSVFNKESGGVRRQAAPQEDAFFTPPSESISTEGVDVEEGAQMPPPPSQTPSTPPQTPQGGEPSPQPPPETPSNAPPQTPPTSGSDEEPSGNFPQFQEEFQPYPTEQQPTSQGQSASQNADQTQSAQQPQEPTKKDQSGEEQTPKKKEEDRSLLASQPKKSELEALKKKPKKGPTPEVKMTYQEKIPEEKKEPIKQDVIDKPSAFLQEKDPPTKETKVALPSEDKGLGLQRTGEPEEKIHPIDELLSGEQTKEKAPEQEKEEMVPTPEKPIIKQTGPFQRFTPQEVRSQKLGKEGATSAAFEGLTVPTSAESEQGGMGEQGKKKDDQSFIEANSDTAGIPLPIFENPVAQVAPSAETPAYSKLSPEIHELFERIGGVILVQQEKGVTTTTININMPNSVFNGTQVILDQYSTAPNSYNIQLVGNPESVKVFSQNLDALKDSFKEANYNFEVNIKNPILSLPKKSPHLIRRKGSSGDKGGKKGK